MSLYPVFILTIPYFLVGGVGILVINRKKPGGRERWTKYIVYFFLTHLLILSLLLVPAAYQLAMAVIAAVGAIEIVLAGSKRISFTRMAAALLVFVPVAAAFMAFSVTAQPPVLLYVYVVVICFDGFSQIMGQLMGRHALVPRVSPGKTIEGLIGGLAIAVLSGIFVRHWANLSMMEAVMASLVISFSSFTGDLTASGYKRLCGIKDYSRLIPGHGGVLDRFDSLIAASAAYWVLEMIR